MPLPPEGQVTPFDKDVFENVLRAALFASDAELMKPPPVSKVSGPDGQPRPETRVEFCNRVVRTALLHLLEQNLVVFPADVKDSLSGWIPALRVGTD